MPHAHVPVGAAKKQVAVLAYETARQDSSAKGLRGRCRWSVMLRPKATVAGTDLAMVNAMHEAHACFMVTREFPVENAPEALEG
jgi:hypothetical protein